jgi:hypothetical protein
MAVECTGGRIVVETPNRSHTAVIPLRRSSARVAPVSIAPPVSGQRPLVVERLSHVQLLARARQLAGTRRQPG